VREFIYYSPLEWRRQRTAVRFCRLPNTYAETSHTFYMSTLISHLNLFVSNLM